MAARQPKGGNGEASGRGDEPAGFGFARRRDVERFLEVRAIQRIRLVEDCENLQFAIGEDALHRKLAAFDEFFHLNELVLFFVQLEDFRTGQDCADTSEGPGNLASLSARITPRLAESPSGLQHAGITDGIRGGVQRQAREPGNGKAGGPGTSPER